MSGRATPRRRDTRYGISATDNSAAVLDVRQLEHDLDALTVQVDYAHARQAFPTDSALADALEVNRSRISAWKRGQVPDEQNRRALRDLAMIVRRLREIYDPDAIPAWLHGLNPELDNRKPIDIIREQPAEIPELLAVIEARAARFFH